MKGGFDGFAASARSATIRVRRHAAWDGGSPAAVMKRAHDEKLRMCDALEEIADSLPDKVDRLKCIGVASALLPLLSSVHRYEEEVLFPAYEAAELVVRRASSSADCGPSISRTDAFATR